ncbi:dual specificity protein phosphatase family protein [Sporobolomyces koalae]|uniref:dual specificity protein phosphatase family protein n=1 Tax=Sporobolomyces koalae TaxID=500713 RepID=UPI00316D3964
MQQVIQGLWIGDYQASQDEDLLRQHGIECIVSAMRQEYDAPGGVDMHRVAVDDTATTNIAEHFVPTASFINAALEKGQSVLVHCQAGVSRSTTLVAAFLMIKLGLNVEQAVDKIRTVRPQVEPTQFFLLQLEMFERCQCEWDPVKWPEERRFLMSFAQSQIMEGASPSIVLAYYPSPAPSPRDRSGSFGLAMTPVASEQISPPLNKLKSGDPMSGSALSTSPPKDAFPPVPSALNGPPTRKRLTPRKVDPTESVEPVQEKAHVAKIGNKEEVKITGRRIRCKMCRRELAAREHIVAHEPGKGQQAFAPNRRDMNAYRAELEKQRLDRIQKEGQSAETADPRAIPSLAAASGIPLPPAPVPVAPPTNPLAGLRISKPLAGLRVAVPRPQPVARPSPMPKPAATPAPDAPSEAAAATEPEAAPSDSVRDASQPADEGPRVVDTAIDNEPLLSSHVCSSYFVEPLSWMSSMLENGALAGKITCPNTKCGAKLGNFDWAGNQCSCGAWVCPGFALNVSRVDEIKA